jgi:thiol:disulfide interchange protein DsbD
MQARYFKANTQPYYVLVSPDEKLLTTPRGYTPDADEYAGFLDCGLNAYVQLSQTAMVKP